MRKKIAMALLIVGCLAVASVPAHATKGGNGNGRNPGSITGTAAGIVLNQAGPHFGDSVSFTTSHGTLDDVGRISLNCVQGGAWVYQWTATETESFLLNGGTWTSGAATCTAELYYFTYKGQTQTGRVTLATTSFEVAA